MSKKSYSKWLKGAIRDPLWYVEIISTLFILILLLAGYDTSTPLYIAWIVLGLTFIASAIRGKNPGRDDLPSTSVRISNAVIGLIMIVGATICLFK